MDKVDQMMAALAEAKPHVTRQVYAGKHEQDRADAEDWLMRWSGIAGWAKAQPRQKPLPARAPFEPPAPTGEAS